MAGLCEGGNDRRGSLKTIFNRPNDSVLSELGFWIFHRVLELDIFSVSELRMAPSKGRQLKLERGLEREGALAYCERTSPTNDRRECN
ncbi:hypothetical protein ANN_13859 [Periplaneta americana]|uniref:Uncharacterized protein n=1 Tax=Periplaneta americana TaxID=6978 RepID=A0ABQ8SUQ2_PERAM|nr:hypothetical protein ANN_13859 [Periplaneta americana]